MPAWNDVKHLAGYMSSAAKRYPTQGSVTT
jgi:hypothetical protein